MAAAASELVEEDVADGANGTDEEAGWARARTLFLGAAATVALGLAVAGSGDRSFGGAVLLAGWGLAVLALHRLGRAGSRA